MKKENRLSQDIPGDPLQTNTSDSPSNESRRTFFKTTSATLLAAPIVLTSRKSEAQVIDPPPSPPTTPWLTELPEAVEPLTQTDLFGDAYRIPQGPANTEYDECGRNHHQRWGEFFSGPQLQYGEADTYELRVKEIGDHVFHPNYPAQRVWNYVGKNANGDPYPNPTIHARYGKPVLLRLYNELPSNHTGFGTPEISLHLHNLHTPSESDGFPGDYFSQTKSGPTLSGPGKFKDQFYPNVYAGLDEFPKSPSNPVGGDRREALGTLWYHDHCLDFTAANATRGMAGFYLIYDYLDTGNENDPAPALKLPSGPYDYPLAFQDKRFDATGIQIFNQLDPEGTFGDKVTVNGKIEPVLRVARRRYRLRLLNAGPSRFYEFYLVNQSNVAQKFTYIANDGNLLPKPLYNQTKVRLGVAERGDIVVDFSQYPLGTNLYIANRLQQTSTRGPGNVQAPGTRILKIIVDRDLPVGEVDNSNSKLVNPDPTFNLRPIRRPTADEIADAPVRSWVFARKNGLWTINDKLVNVNSAGAHIAAGSYEIWDLSNPSGGWSHPVHVHFEEGHILQKFRNGTQIPVPAHEKGRKDVYTLGPNERMRVFLRFRDFPGKYVMHCHNMIHEDHAMMVRWDIVD